MKVIGVIPARYHSTRLPAKVLAPLKGRPMIEHVFRRAQQCALLDEVLVACDDERVRIAVCGFGGKAVMTSVDHCSGTDRIAEAVRDIPAEIIVNIQGDEPLIRPEMIGALIQAVKDDGCCVMATLVKRMDDLQDLANPNVVKVVKDQQGRALYFSRAAIPFNRDGADLPGLAYYKHLGLYAYRKPFLLKMKDLPPSILEQAEKLEQLRVLEAGYPVKVVETFYDTVSVDTAEDLKHAEALLEREEGTIL